MATTNTRKSTTKGKYVKPKNGSTSAVVHTSTTTGRKTNKKKKSITRSIRNWSRKIKATFKSIYSKINKKDVKWYWDLKKWIPIICIMMVILYAIGYNKGKTNQIEIFEAIPPETIYIEVTEEPTVPETTEPELDEEAVALAILADSSASGKSDTVKRILMWVVINRVEDRANGYGGTIIDVINRPKQWQGYNPDGMYLQSTYDIAVEVLNTWRNNGPRPIYNDMLWSVYNADGSITIRNRFGDEKGRMEQTFE